MLNEDKQLLEQIAGGDVKALGILYVLYAGAHPKFRVQYASELLGGGGHHAGYVPQDLELP